MSKRTCETKAGSALLIVLGFLSFMMVSAVSFAIYMRIEHQASANYRHVTSARHYLESALYHGMEEIDSELRLMDPSVHDVKFPDWDGNRTDGYHQRVLASAVPLRDNNKNNARVLTLESLSFIPGLFINDVRRYAIPTPADPNYSEDDETQDFMGAKWRPLTVAVTRVDGNNHARSPTDVGRFAYVCLNVSDLLDVNTCRAALENANAISNRVSLNHLFTSESAAKAFDDSFKQRDRFYDSVQDFYACMDARNDPTFKSPYQEYIDGQNGIFSQLATTDEGRRHVLITDSLVKAEPRAAANKICNLQMAVMKGNQNGNNVNYTARSRSRFTTIFDKADQMKTALDNAMANSLPTYNETLVANLIADYLDTDSIPQLNMPCAERTPMINRLVLMQGLRTWRPVLNPAKDERDDKSQTITFPAVSGDDILAVETIFPFKEDDISNSFTVEAYINVIVKFGTGSTMFLQKSNENKSIQYLTGKTVARRQNGPSCLHILDLGMIEEFEFMVRNAQGAIVGDDLRVMVNCLVALKDKENKVVDAVPFAFNDWNSEKSEQMDMIGVSNNLYFRTGRVDFTAAALALNWEWLALACPDARFNYRSRNWYTGTSTEMAPRALATLNGELSELLGKDGRDGDIYCSVSDAGYFQSPGEWGFIIRPYNWDAGRGDPGFSTYPATAVGTADASHMFRTLRLYDHGESHKADQVYKYFTFENEDGSLMGPRVNPLSNQENVLRAALAAVPVNYRWASDTDNMKDHLFYAAGEGADPYSSLKDQSSWNTFREVWYRRLQEAKKKNINGYTINNSYRYNLSDVYCLDDVMGWYSRSGHGINAEINGLNVAETERKMLCAYTLDNFSDRQQLFLFFIAAEATVPAFGATMTTGIKSLAGGKAVALVWRDPYPFQYDKENDSWWKKGQKAWYKSDNGDNYHRVSPWYQYEVDGAGRSETSTDSGSARYDGFHEMRVLYFKQLNN